MCFKDCFSLTKTSARQVFIILQKMKPRPEPSIATSTQLKLEFMSPSSEATSGRRKITNQSSYIHSNKLVYIVIQNLFFFLLLIMPFYTPLATSYLWLPAHQIFSRKVANKTLL